MVYIALVVVSPLLLLMLLGAIADRALSLDLRSFNRFNLHVLVPGLILAKVPAITLTAEQVLDEVVLFALLHLVATALAGRLLAVAGPLSRSRGLAVGSSCFYNTGNFGLPFVLLAFGERLVPVFLVLLLFQGISIFVIGPLLLRGGEPAAGARDELRAGLGRLARLPAIWAIAAALLMRALGVSLPGPLHEAAGFLGDGIVPVAVTALGAEMARTRALSRLLESAPLVMLRVVVGPLIGAGLALLFELPADIELMLVCACGLPTAVNLYLLADEYGYDKELAGLVVFWSTALCLVTLPAILWLSGWAPPS